MTALFTALWNLWAAFAALLAIFGYEVPTIPQ